MLSPTIDLVDALPRHTTKRYRTRPYSAITHVILHHSATLGGDPGSFARYHVEHNDWPGIGYHAVIARDGARYKTNNDNTVSYHAGSWNRRAIGVCLVGDFTREEPTVEQLVAAGETVLNYADVFNVPAENIVGHKDIDPSTSCPGNFPLVKVIRAYVTGRRETKTSPTGG